MTDQAASPGGAPGPFGRKWVAGGLGVLAVAAIAVGVVVATSPGESVGVAAGPQPAQTQPSSSVAEPAPNPPPAPGPGQSPGTVRLPQGGTAALVRKEITEDGTLPIPESLHEATWWGAALGAPQGVALLSGHVNWKGRIGPFDELWRDATGDEIAVVDTGGGHWEYRVVDAVTVHKDELPSRAEKLFDQLGPHRLVLVTCGGDYVGGTNGYEDNRIVTAELVSRP